MGQNPFEAVAKAEDLADLLDHIAWREVLRPALAKARDNYTKMLVNSTLGLPVMVETKQGPATISREQLAGRIDGFDFVITTIESILARGTRAVEELRSKGLSLASLDYGNSGPSSNIT